MAIRRDRFFALFGAILFLVTASAFSILVVWSMIDSKDDTSTDTSQTTDNNNTSTEGNTLQGTKLNDFTPITGDVTNLKVTDIKVGTGDEVKASDTVTVDYTGAIAATGIIFQSSLDSGQPVTFGLDGVIKGWTDGVPGMKVGGTRRLIIPADQAYGATPPSGSGIPVNAPLVFDITLHKIGS